MTCSSSIENDFHFQVRKCQICFSKKKLMLRYDLCEDTIYADRMFFAVLFIHDVHLLPNLFICDRINVL